MPRAIRHTARRRTERSKSRQPDQEHTDTCDRAHQPDRHDQPADDIVARDGRHRLRRNGGSEHAGICRKPLSPPAESAGRGVQAPRPTDTTPTASTQCLADADLVRRQRVPISARSRIALLLMAHKPFLLEDAQLRADRRRARVAGKFFPDEAGCGAPEPKEDVHDLSLATRQPAVPRSFHAHESSTPLRSCAAAAAAPSATRAATMWDRMRNIIATL